VALKQQEESNVDRRNLFPFFRGGGRKEVTIVPITGSNGKREEKPYLMRWKLWKKRKIILDSDIMHLKKKEYSLLISFKMGGGKDIALFALCCLRKRGDLNSHGVWQRTQLPLFG